MSSAIISDGETYVFNSVTVGTLGEKTFTLTNSSNSKILNLSAASLSSPYRFKGGDFPGTGGTCGLELNGSESCTFVVEFAPNDSQTHIATLQINFINLDGVSSVATREISGAGLTPALLSISDGTTYNYGRVVINQYSDKSFTITNSGQSTSTSLSPSVNGTPYTLPGGGTCGTTLVGGSNCTFIVRLTPTAFSLMTDTLTLTYNNGLTTTSTTRDLIGTGVGVSGTIDTTFGNLGKILLTNLGRSADTSGSAFLTTDGSKIYAVARESFGTNYGNILIRRNAINLSLDTSFNTQGFIFLDNQHFSVLTTWDGPIVPYDANRFLVAGNDSGISSYISRYRSDGQLDTTFNTAGYRSMQGGFNTLAAVQTDGKILLYGDDSVGTGVIKRFMSDGQGDGTFTFINITGALKHMGVTSWGGSDRIVITYADDNATASPIHLERYESSGILDTSFHTTGTYTFDTNLLAGGGAVVRYDRGFILDTSGGVLWFVNSNEAASGKYFFAQKFNGSGTQVGSANLTGVMDNNWTIRSSALQTDGKFAVLGSDTANNYSLALLTSSDTLDTSFQTSGVATTSFGANDTPNVLILDTTGRYVMLGDSQTTDGNNFSYIIRKSNGTLDTSFDTDGKKIENLAGGDSVAKDLVIDSTGRMYVAAEVFVGGTMRATLLRYNSDYTLDTTFSTDGILYTTLGTSPLGTAGTKLALDTTGKIALAHNKGIAVFLSNGTLFSGFNATGNYPQIGFQALVYQTNGRLVTVGENGPLIYLGRFYTSGNLDTSFRTSGKQTETFPSGDSGAFSVNLQTDGNILVASYATNAIQGMVTARLLPTGKLDTSFSTTGMRFVTFGSSSKAKKVLLQGNSIYVGGGTESSNEFTFARYDLNGGFDTSFRTTGRVSHSITPLMAGSVFVANDMIVTTDGGILEVGGAITTTNNAVTFPWTVLRIRSDGTLETGFGTAGKMRLGFTTSGDQAWTVTTQSDGRHLIGGSLTNQTNFDLAIYRIWP